ncbi:cation diffusion facilitator family transporter [Sporanaerobacter acetigenes]|uniref:Cation diffusion facilitator family transporter n=1 Tax=Sporanaerobacter acetigenes DSM 13106 TaxID=1123281 RepID=A0A1M5W9Z5_9FIRM|nr:cation diffusion facilitator family transporter [Sporanaerobacter acetigenes]SHH84399.1 cation diffusion facilitator family transporter [Sporanaerobacter acetigenes DSM 13106]
MITDFLLKFATKGNTDFSDNVVRGKVGYLAGIVGIIVNLILFIIKLTIGIIVSSIAVLADAFNNLSDAASSIITIVGFKLSSLPPDKEHPYGHGRIEYLSALIVAFMVMLVGFQFIKTSINRIMNPQAVVFEWIPFIILLVSILFKVWLSIFNKKLGDKISSSALKATSTDALGDVFTTSVVAISLLASLFTDIPIDGYIGVLVAIAILYAGFNLVKETINPLIGEAPSEELINSIKNGVLSYEYITGVHDLIIHNYGPGRTMASIHAEFPSNVNVMAIHEVIDKAERELSKKLELHLVIHMDPICMDTKEIVEARNEVEKIIKGNTTIKSMHDFRIVGKGDKKNLIFDIVVDGNKLSKDITEEDIKLDISNAIKKNSPQYNCIITIDKEY